MRSLRVAAWFAVVVLFACGDNKAAQERQDAAKANASKAAASSNVCKSYQKELAAIEDSLKQNPTDSALTETQASLRAMIDDSCK